VPPWPLARARSVLSLKALNTITSPGGELYESQQRLVRAMCVWSTLFAAGAEAQDEVEAQEDS
jgi:hypothetical protein